MKIRMLAGLILATSMSGAFAASTAICSVGGAATSTVAGVSANFILSDMTVKCSTNVQLAYDQDATKAVVCSNSSKGKNNFGGSTTGGAVKPAAACTVAGGACQAQAAVLANDGC